MSNRKLPQTSLDAYEKAKEFLQPHHQKILSALKILGKANYETIAKRVKLDKHAVGRRTSELEARQLIYKPGTKSPTSSGNGAFDYMLTEAGKNVEISPENEIKEKSIKQKEILPAATVKNLFEL